MTYLLFIGVFILWTLLASFGVFWRVSSKRSRRFWRTLGVRTKRDVVMFMAVVAVAFFVLSSLVYSFYPFTIPVPLP